MNKQLVEAYKELEKVRVKCSDSYQEVAIIGALDLLWKYMSELDRGLVKARPHKS